MMAHPSIAPLNGLTVDVEDWIQSVFDSSAPLTDCFVRNTHRVLEMLASHGVRGTFFVLGLAAEKSPDLVRAIHSAGHEVQSHGYGHRPVHTLTPRQFRENLKRSKDLLEDLSGQAVVGYRAPAFSITLRNLWAFDSLVECGFSYDSSVFPVRTRRYGIAGVPRFPHRVRTPGGNTLIEIPVASYRCLGRALPLGGGGYFRLFPDSFIHRAVATANRGGRPVTVYLHPYEFNATEITDLSHSIPPLLQIHQTLGRRGIPRKIGRLLREFRFGPLQDVIASLSPIPTHDCYSGFAPNGSKPVAVAT
jgi:polysaccharide deacetylase family protein (PEP-CTERM system associated)